VDFLLHLPRITSQGYSQEVATMKKATRNSNRGESIVGRSIGRRRVVNVPLPELLTDKIYAGTGFDRFVRAAEAWAKETLERAGLPVADGMYHLRGGKSLTPEEVAVFTRGINRLMTGTWTASLDHPGEYGRRMDVVKARGFREFNDDE